MLVCSNAEQRVRNNTFHLFIHTWAMYMGLVKMKVAGWYTFDRQKQYCGEEIGPRAIGCTDYISLAFQWLLVC